MRASKKFFSIIICMILFIGMLIGFKYFINEEKKTKDYDMDASDSIHYKLGETILFENKDITFNGIQEKPDSIYKKWKLDMNMDDDTYRIFHDRYTFKLAENDRLLLQTNCDYDNAEIIVVDLLPDKNRLFDQVVIVDNSNQEIVFTLNLNK